MGVSAELAGYRALWAAAPAEMADRHGIASVDIAGGTCLAVASQAGNPMLCHAVGVGVGREVGDAELDRIAAFYAARGGRHQVSAAPGATGDLGDRLLARGYRPARPWMTFHRPAGEIAGPATALRTAAADAGTAPAFGAIVVAEFGLPPDLAGWIARLVDAPGWTCLLALDGDVPVGAAGVVVHGDVAWFALGATIAEHRGKGAQGALFAARSRVALAAGARHFVTETGAPADGEAPGPSYRNMLRWGFREAELRPNYASPAG
jgi:hypothetical protein